MQSICKATSEEDSGLKSQKHVNLDDTFEIRCKDLQDEEL